MTNHKLINKLITDNHPEKQDKIIAKDQVPTGHRDEILITSHRVISTRYKMYIVLLLILIIVAIYNFLIPAYKTYTKKNEELHEIKQKVEAFETDKQIIQEDKDLISSIETNEELISQCVNIEGNCDQLPESIINNLDLVKSYINLNSLYNPKMILDEKVLLTNLNEFLVKNNPLEPSKSSTNGEILRISIGDEAKYDETLHFVPVQILIKFENEQGLLSFINNIENKLLPDPQYRLLYYIDNIKYDIVSHKEEQEVETLLYLFYTNHGDNETEENGA